ncbi:DUF5013 domain-containing protein [Pedobacter steynii]|nr:DUF4998 domain-containing protein [Pedobacter steynii]NQX42286.1 DUF5013 domain-containing protein [Pedobacter steynii]
MKRYKIIACYIVALLVLITGACTKMDDYKNQYMKGGAIVYPGKMDSVKIFSGKNRVKVTGLFTSDLNIVKYRVFWNSRQDSVEVTIKRTPGVDTAKVMIPDLPEGIMGFQIRTYDALGHISVPVNAAVKVYGALYQSSCINRGITDTAIQPDGSASINWVDVNANSGIINMGIKYSDNNNKLHDTLIRSVPTGLTTRLPNFKLGSAISYRTAYLPNPTAIDTFYVAYQTYGIKADVTSLYFTNYQQPFTSTTGSGTGRWRNPTAWIVTNPVLNHGGNGGWASDDGTVLAMESGLGAAPVVNGKIFQTFTLPAGNYTFSAALGNNSFSNPVYVVAAAGSTLPDVALVPVNSIKFASLKDQRFDFIINEPTQVSIGFVANMTGDEYWRVKSVKLIKN